MAIAHRCSLSRLLVLWVALSCLVCNLHRLRSSNDEFKNAAVVHWKTKIDDPRENSPQSLDGWRDSSHVTGRQQDPLQLLIPPEPDPSCQQKVHAAIENVVPLNESRFLRCPVTSQVQITVPNKEQDELSSVWILQSLDEYGNPKTQGGDEYYITWTDENAVPDAKTNITHAALVARALDQKDGSYVLDFVTSPMNPNPTFTTGRGRLIIHFEYTCGVGRMGQPMKNSWNSAGYTHTDYHVDNVPLPFHRKFQPPQTSIDLGSYEAVVFLGDSVMGNFIGEEYHFGKTNIYRAGKNPESALNSQSVSKWLDQLRTGQGDRLHQANQKKTALVVGSSTWDVLNNSVDQWMDWKDHADSLRHLVQSIRSEYPNVELMWKSATAIHICNPNVEEMALRDRYWGVERVRYMSESRSYDIDQVQKKVMAELQVPVLDVYEATYLAADWSKDPSDARHYYPELNLRMLNWFYKT